MNRALLVVSVLLFFSLIAHADPLPSREPQVVVPQLRAWHEHGSFAQIEVLLGKPDMDFCSAFSVAVFRLTDGTSVYVKSTPSHNRIYTISRSAPGKIAEMLYSPLPDELDRPQPTSAPF